MAHKSRRIWIASAVALLALAGLTAGAQEWAGKGRLQGEIKDEQGKPVEGAKITLRKGADRVNVDTPGPKPLTTNAKGKWAIAGLAGGSWGVLIEKEGYLISEGQVKVDEFNLAKPLNITLKVIPKEMIEAAERASAGGIINGADELFAQQKYAEARAEYERARAQVDEANKGKLDLRIAKTYLQEKNYDQTAKTLQAVLAVEPNNLEAIRILAATQYELKQPDKAIETLKTAANLAPNDTGVLQELVNFLVDAGREEEAKVYMAKLPQGTKVDPSSLLNIGIRQFNEGKVQEAFDSFDRVVKENAEMAEAYYYRGLTALGLSTDASLKPADQKAKAEIAKADFKKLLELDPNGSHADDAREFLKSF
ncbi:MAG TPA: tetratricopeptide repeat protein [Thermoanaerobaculia bacterium]|nr:tetratricopeptide repeat protein [Thermoanaerobaculia bacterium]